MPKTTRSVVTDTINSFLRISFTFSCNCYNKKKRQATSSTGITAQYFRGPGSHKRINKEKNHSNKKQAIIRWQHRNQYHPRHHYLLLATT